MNRRGAIPAIVGALLLVLVVVTASAAMVVRVDQFAIVTQFGKPVRVHEESGLYFKLPFVQDVVYLDKRIRGWDDTAVDTKTADSRQIDYTIYARWRIVDPLKFYKNAGSDKAAYAGMDSIVTDRIQKELRSRKLAAIVRQTGRAFEVRSSVDLQNIFDEYQECNPAVNPEFRALNANLGGAMGQGPTNMDDTTAMRSQIVAEILRVSNERLREEYGIELRDMHFKYLNYARQVHDQIISEIETDRRDDISSYLEIGNKCVGYIKRLTDAERGSILGEGQRRVRQIDGQATARAIEIKSRSFLQDPEFYRFLRNLEVLQATLKDDTRLVLSTDSPVLKLLEDATLLAPVPARDVPLPDLETPIEEMDTP